MNPTLAISTWIWSAGAYNRNMTEPTDPTKTVVTFDYFHMGRYVAIYIFAPLVAALFSGPLAGLHLKYIEKGNPHAQEWEILIAKHDFKTP